MAAIVLRSRRRTSFKDGCLGFILRFPKNLQTEPEQSLFFLAELSFINWIKYHGRIKSLHLFKQIFLLVEKKSSEINPDLVQFWKSTEDFYQLTVMLLKSE